MLWKDAVLQALYRYAERHATPNVDRQGLIDEELPQMMLDTDSTGATPTQTLSRVLQELRDDGLLYFISNGNYLLADQHVDVESEDLPDDAIDIAIKTNKLGIGILPAGDAVSRARRRKGQKRIRVCTLENYGYQCALCDLRELTLLVASHIARWADAPNDRGNLSNLICMCRFHDVLFEYGYFSIRDDFKLLLRPQLTSRTIQVLLGATAEFRLPKSYRPARQFLAQHRIRSGFAE